MDNNSLPNLIELYFSSKYNQVYTGYFVVAVLVLFSRYKQLPRIALIGAAAVSTVALFIIFEVDWQTGWPYLLFAVFILLSLRFGLRYLQRMQDL